jgi:hypothetical protein
MRHRVAATVVAAAVSVPIVPALAGTQAAHAATTSPSRFVPVTPCRLLDTRGGAGPVDAGGAIDVEVVGDRCQIPDRATAAALTMTVSEPDGAGFLTVWPGGEPRPAASVLNFQKDETVANSQLVQLGDEGDVSVYSLAQTDVVVDVTGYFEPVDGGDGVSSGRFVPVAARRLVDTVSSNRPAPGSAVRVDPDVPADAVAVAVNITTTQSRGAGYFTAYPAGSSLPTASVLNTDAAGQSRASAAIVPVSTGGFDVYTSSGDHVIVDITGYFTGPSAPQTDEGLFVASDPTRLADTRLATGAFGGPRLWDAGGRQFATSQLTGGSVAAVAVNVVMTETEDLGYVSAGPARVDQALTSTVNASSPQLTVANASIVQVSTAGIELNTLNATHLVVDVMGWFTGQPLTATTAPPVNTPNADRKVYIIADSAIAGIRWTGALAGLQGMVADDRLESCRRLVQPSCRGREGYAPRTTVNEIAVLPSIGPEDVLVIGAGYDDWSGRFSGDFDVVVAAARAKGFHHIVWLTYRSNVAYTMPSGLRSNYALMNDVLHAKVATRQYRDIRLWDFNAYTVGVNHWFTGDGIHLRVIGGWGVADYLSRQMRAFDDRPCAQPMQPGQPVPDPCPDPDRLPPTYPNISGLYGIQG